MDTNAIITALPHWSKFRIVLDALVDDEYDAIVTTEIFMEYEEKLREKFDPETADLNLDMLKMLPNVFIQETWFQFHLISQDPDDNKFVDCALAANAHFIVTNDKHFNVLKSLSFPKVNLLTVEEFTSLLLTKTKGLA
ncbi:MAG: putative toxin-antitoxin system toxin component, PIN family [Bacteroidetes bacterium]|nr:putative toxin-antitoxin system toxin component, PIN family [Bacteroidota bacterium]